jgi:hypothetical protein
LLEVYILIEKYSPTTSLSGYQILSSFILDFSLAKDSENGSLECAQDIEKLFEGKNI